ncbi:olfactory receptor 18-like [Manis pentadactyla]|uniref:olfactory receptor 18-like n=1 Tax=Manis pentadactyla TaxID=143292 RepID=UPI00255CB022|nr:olfactory receptor 18-like [Manis pentadactyla]
MYFLLSSLSLADIGFTSTTVPKMLVNTQTHKQFVAICHPLHYTGIMRAHLCGRLVLVPWFFPDAESVDVVAVLLLQTGDSTLLLCTRSGPHACLLRHTHQSHPAVHGDCLSGHCLFSGILFSYTRIASSILKIPSANGKCKAFSTCASHLSVVPLFYGAGLGVYLSSNACSQKGMIGSVVYRVVTPMLNPFIYSLQNKDVKWALGRLLNRATSCL